MKNKKTTTFEELLGRLEEISQSLEKEEVGLDEAISLYEEGIELTKACNEKLKNAELKITVLKKKLEDDEDNESQEGSEE